MAKSTTKTSTRKPGSKLGSKSGSKPGSKRDPGPSVKDQGVYEKVRDSGASKQKAARIANAAANTSRKSVARKGGSSSSYDDWTIADLRKKAADVGISGRSRMNKAELVKALRNH